MCNSSLIPFLSATYGDVFAAESKVLANAHVEKVLPSAIETPKELPNVPGHLATKSSLPEPDE
jgi:hypothetical protein